MPKTILISGGSDGLGKSIAEVLTPNHQVIILSHNQAKLETVAAELKCDFVYADVTEFSSIKLAVDKVLSKYKKIDVLINNAGIWMEGELDSMNPQKITEIFGVNTLGTIFLTKTVLPGMKENGEGRIINIISEDGLIAKKNKSVYSSSKWAITGFTKCLQEDLHGSNIAVTGIYPGVIKTSLFEKQGVERDLTYALDPSEVARLIEYVINLSQETLLPEIRIKNIKNPNNMDDTTSNPISLDINPDLMTTQTSSPQANSSQTPPVAIPPVGPGVIDITPGTGDESHPAKVEDITPAETPPAENPAPIIQETQPQTTQPEVTPPTGQEPAGVIDITPGTPAPAVTEEPSGMHLTDVLPTPVTQEPPAEAEAPSVITPVVGTPAVDTPAVDTPAVEPTAASTTPAAPDVELPPAQVNPLQEDPDLVKLNK